eukprot:3210565-Lingulodinium_polyedra.AAC.1
MEDFAAAAAAFEELLAATGHAETLEALAQPAAPVGFGQGEVLLPPAAPASPDPASSSGSLPGGGAEVAR